MLLSGLANPKSITISDLTDVDETTPAFCAVPKSRRAATLMDAKEQLGDAYCEVPVRGPAGSCCIIDCTCTIHFIAT